MGDLACPCPERSDVFAAGGIAAVEQDHVGIFGENLVEHSPDAVVILIGRAGGERDACAGGQHGFDFRTALGGKKIPAVDHRGGHSAMVDE